MFKSIVSFFARVFGVFGGGDFGNESKWLSSGGGPKVSQNRRNAMITYWCHVCGGFVDCRVGTETQIQSMIITCNKAHYQNLLFFEPDGSLSERLQTERYFDPQDDDRRIIMRKIDNKYILMITYRDARDDEFLNQYSDREECRRMIFRMIKNPGLVNFL